MRKKFLTRMVLTALIGALALMGCGEKEAAVSTNSASENTVVTVDDSERGEFGQIRSSLTSVEVAKLMGNGINLGNTMESYGRSQYGTGAAATSYETFWGQPVTTQESISGMKKAGFDTIRIPVAWTNTMDFENGDYTISEDYLNRVQEIVDYARNEGMYVIINDHWDGGWWGMFGSASEETRAAAMELYTSMWTQIAERFAGYSDYVIFESANEEVGYRLNDTDIAADSGTLSDAECFEMANKINQTFVDTIRATGGNNAQRFLLIAGFGTDISNTVNDAFVMPEDTVENRLLISVHYYDPSGYCIFTSLSDWGTQDDYEDMNTGLEKMTKFTEAGYGVVIGEYGVLIEGQETLKEGTEEYLTNFLDNCELYGYCPVLWDCNNVYNRNECKMNFINLSRLYTKYSYDMMSSTYGSEEELQAAMQEDMDKNYSNADSGFVLTDDKAVAWIMFNSGDWGTQYSVGDVYDPTLHSEGVTAVDADITGEGTYTVSLDFTGTAGGYVNGTVFSALAIDNGESLYPGYYIVIKDIQVNGESIELLGLPYTTSDDGNCTRVNLYNEWVTQVPEEARMYDESLGEPSPVIIDNTITNIQTLSVTFDYVAP